jgi:raffinose/stachyose/melibiose transport system permease protein
MTQQTLVTTAPGQVPTRRRRRLVGKGSEEHPNIPGTIILVICSIAVFLPLYATVTMAFKTTTQSVSGQVFSLPSPLSVEGFVEAWRLTNFPRGFAISLFVTIITVVGTVILAALAAYAIARNWDRKLFRGAFYYLLAAMFLPFPVLALSQVKLTGIVGLANPVGVALLHVMFQLSFSVLLFTAFIRGLPEELEESARLEGATTWMVFRRIVFPLMAPMSATVAIFAFLASWNDFMMPSLIIADSTLQTLPVLQSVFQTQFSSNYNVAFASYLMAMAPAIIVYAFTQRWVMSGVTQGAIK